MLTELSIAEPIEQVKQQGKGYQQGHDPRISQFESRSRLTITADGGGDYPLNCLSGQTAVVADPLDVEETSVDGAAYEGKVGKI
jgi:hypothetical protein